MTAAELLALLGRGDYELAQTLKPAISTLTRDAAFWDGPDAAAMLEWLCIVDDPQFELEILGSALVAHPDRDDILDAYLNVGLRSGRVVLDDARSLSAAAEVATPTRRSRLLAWQAVLEHLDREGEGCDQPRDPTDLDRDVLVVARAWRQAGAKPT